MRQWSIVAGFGGEDNSQAGSVPVMIGRQSPAMIGEPQHKSSPTQQRLNSRLGLKSIEMLARPNIERVVDNGRRRRNAIFQPISGHDLECVARAKSRDDSAH